MEVEGVRVQMREEQDFDLKVEDCHCTFEDSKLDKERNSCKDLLLLEVDPILQRGPLRSQVE